MTAEHAELLARILAFDIDGEERALSFPDRLARENGWSITYAELVVVEYKRFIFLAVTGREPVTPSDQVDQAWHLHVTYTRSYWERFCTGVLGRPLHHEPTKGGPEEAAKFDRQYRATLARYRAEFGSEPPSDIWPPPEVRFGEDLHFVRVNTVRNHIVSEDDRRRRALIWVMFGIPAALFGLPFLSGGFTIRITEANPLFAIPGVLLLALTVGLLILEVRLARRVRSMYLNPQEPVEDVPELNRYDVAYLFGGQARAAQAAVARLVEANVLAYDPATGKLTRTGTVADTAPAAEREVFARVLPDAPDGTPAAVVVRQAAGSLINSFTHLARCGLVASEKGQSRAVAVTRTALVFFLFCAMIYFVAGAMFLGYAISKDGPPAAMLLGLLTWFTVGGLLVAWVGRKPLVTDRAAAIIREHKERMRAASHEDDLGSRVAVLGPGGLSRTALVGLAAALVASTTATVAGAADGAGGCGGGGCGGGCGGCGGCGG